MKPEVNDKYEGIIEAAIRRFSHFGVQKTTLTEIADDVAISKQALAYYFTDKQSLISAVVTQIVNQYLQEVEKAFTAATTIEEALIGLIEVKQFFFERYYMLYLQNRGIDLKTGNTYLQGIKDEMRTHELQIVSRQLTKGIQTGELEAVDVDKTSTLLLDALFAFECALKVEKPMPEHADFLKMIHKQKEMVQLLIQGLKKPQAVTKHQKENETF